MFDWGGVCLASKRRYDVPVLQLPSDSLPVLLPVTLGSGASYVAVVAYGLDCSICC